MGRMGHSSIAAALPRHAGTARITISTRAAPAYRRYQMAALTLSIMALCLLLRTLRLGALPLFFDEGVDTRAAQVVGAVPGPASLLTSLQYGAPPLYSWLAAPLTRLLPDPLLAARLTSALIGTATALAVWTIAREISSSRAEGPLAAILYALCPFTLFYNRMALLDGLLAACGAGALYFALRLARDARGRDAIALGLCLGAAMLTKIFAVDMLLLPLLAVVAARPAQRRAVRRLALVAAALGLAPLAALLLTPQGGGLLSATHAHAHAAGSVAATVGQQLATWGSALWLYLTPPVLLLALLGLWSIRRQRAALVIGPWALLGGLPPVLVPGAFLAPRYFLYSAVPILVLAAYGLVALVAAIVAFPRLGAEDNRGPREDHVPPGTAGVSPACHHGRTRCWTGVSSPRPWAGETPAVPGGTGLSRTRPWAGETPAVPGGTSLLLVRPSRRIAAAILLMLGAGLAVIPSVQADAALIGAPARAPYIPFDRWQYVTGWPSGYALMDVVTYLRRQERHGPITVVSSIYNPPGDALAVLLGHDPRVTLTNRDFDTLRAQPLRATPGRPIYVIACHPYGQQVHPDIRDLRAVLRAPDGDGAGGVDVYAVIGR